jgi:hypothetical protein
MDTSKMADVSLNTSKQQQKILGAGEIRQQPQRFWGVII